jgi:hypothetical protein
MVAIHPGNQSRRAASGWGPSLLSKIRGEDSVEFPAPGAPRFQLAHPFECSTIFVAVPGNIKSFAFGFTRFAKSTL